MNQSLQSYTPTVKPLNYDALATRQGCEADSGNAVLDSLPFTMICVFDHDATDYDFNKLDTVSYAVGPDVTGAPATLPHMKVWTAWVGSVGIRIGAIGSVTPPSDSLGLPSGLYPATITDKLTHCFNSLGLLYMAMEKSDPGFIEVKWYTDAFGTMADLSFAGESPMLFDLGDVDVSGDAGVVCYYVRHELPFQIFARFASEAFATEHIIMPDLRVNAVRLISIRSVGNLVIMLAADDTGRDVTLTAGPYSQNARSKTGLTTSFVSGICVQAVAPVVLSSIKSKMTISFDHGTMFLATVATHPIPQDASAVTVGFDSGEMDLAT